MNSGIFKVNFKDLVKGVSIAVIVVVLGAVQQAFATHGFDFAAFDWPMILDIAWKAAGAYIVNNFLSTEDGKVLGVMG